MKRTLILKTYGQIVLAVFAAMPAIVIARYLGFGDLGQCVFCAIALSAHYCSRLS